MKESFLAVETIKLRIIRNTSKDILVHLGILPYKENIDAYNFIKSSCGIQFCNELRLFEDV